MPDPVWERNKQLLVYAPAQPHYSESTPPLWKELEPGHFVRGSEEELDIYRKML